VGFSFPKGLSYLVLSLVLGRDIHALVSTMLCLCMLDDDDDDDDGMHACMMISFPGE
jgi:hypothetical protein